MKNHPLELSFRWVIFQFPPEGRSSPGEKFGYEHPSGGNLFERMMFEINLQKGVAVMNAKQKRFCDEYLIDCNATQAAIRAGYSPKTAKQIGQENLTKPALKKYIDEQLELLHNKRTADAQEVLEYLTSVMRGEHTEQTLQLVGDGVQTISDIDVSAKERLKAAELIGKRYGMFKDGLNVGGVVPVMFVDDLGSDDE